MLKEIERGIDLILMNLRRYIHYIHGRSARTLHACAYIVRGDYRTGVYVIVYECFVFIINENCLAYTIHRVFARA
jgi:hypothetical protein